MREMPPEPALDAFITRYSLRPSMEEIRQSVTSLKVRGCLSLLGCQSCSGVLEWCASVMGALHLLFVD